ncbi:MAG: adenylate/guanylate cyclase domain-containing protein [Planctomycetota bacterium]|nr:adenylate/guanylate cyclase domain-containing protein [Planctomycetota bacterium]
MPTKNLSIMFTDIKGFTERTSKETRQGLVNLLKKHDNLLLPVIRYFEGTVVKTIGDAFLVHFDSATDAVLCGLAIQEVLRKFNTNMPEKERLKVRVAINAGDVELKDGDVLGEAVNIAARLEGVTEAGEVYFTEAVYLAMNRKEVPSAEVGEKTFQGIPHPVRVFRVTQDPTSEQARKLGTCVHLTALGPRIEGLRDVGAQKSGKAWWLAAAALAVAALAVAFVWKPPPADTKPAEPLWKRPQALLDGGEPLIAHEAAHELWLQHPEEEKLREIAFESARRQAEFLEKERTEEEAAAWLRAQVDAKRYLKPLEPRLLALETRVKVRNLLDKERSSRVIERTWELVREHPKSPEVPYEAAGLLENRYIVEAILPFYEEALERGGYAGDERIFQACLRSFERNGPEGSSANTAHDLLRTRFEARRVPWAAEALVKGQGLDALNAWKILKEVRHELTQDEGYLRLFLSATGQGSEAGIKALLTEGPADRRAQAAAVLAAALKEKLIPMPQDGVVEQLLQQYAPKPVEEKTQGM